jgi:phosphonate transport system ATP-binding protein
MITTHMIDSAYAIEVADANKTFGAAAKALRGVNLRVRAGECVGLLGASGSGKSTLLRSLCGLEMLDAQAGHIHLHGQTLQSRGRLGPQARALRGMTGIIFQQFNLIGRMSVLGNVLTGLLPQLPLRRSLLGRFTDEERLTAMRALDAVGMAEFALQRASTLSGGQQQRAAIARTLAQGARIVLADEPVASLDPQSTSRVMDLLRGLNRDHGITLLISLHNVALARQYCDRIVALRQGELVYDGPPLGLDIARLQQLYGTQAEQLITAPEPLAQSPSDLHGLAVNP